MGIGCKTHCFLLSFHFTNIVDDVGILFLLLVSVVLRFMRPIPFSMTFPFFGVTLRTPVFFGVFLSNSLGRLAWFWGNQVRGKINVLAFLVSLQRRFTAVLDVKRLVLLFRW